MLHYVVSYFTLNGRGESQQQQQPVIAMSNANATSNATSDVATNGTVASNGAVATIDDAVGNGYTWEMPVSMTVYSVLFAVFAGLYIAVENSDASQPGGLGWPCFAETQRTQRYCGLCRKSVMGLDHHCIWLNTCIGKRNYHLFFWCLVFGILSSGWQFCVGLWVLITQGQKFLGETQEVVGMVMLLLYSLLVFAVCALIVSTLAFQLYTMCEGLGTYDYLMREAKRKRAKARRKAEREAEREAERKAAAAAAAAEIEMVDLPPSTTPKISSIAPLMYIHGLPQD